MADQHYDLLFNGQIVDGFYVDFVKADLKTLFKTDDAYIEKLFSGQAQVIKKQVDKATAIRFQQAFKKAGAKLIVKQHGAASQPAAPKTMSPEQPVQADAAAVSPSPGAAQTQISGSAHKAENDDSLIEHHQPELTAPESIPDWDVSAPGAVLSQASESPVADVDTSRLSLAETGVSLTDPSDDPAVAPVATDHLSVAPPGQDLESLDDKPEPVRVDISHLSLKS